MKPLNKVATFIFLFFSAAPCLAQNRLNVKDFGAKGDGSTDDLQAIIRCLDSAVSKSTEAYFPSGSYLISKSIKINLKGNGKLKIVGENVANPNFMPAIECKNALTALLYVFSQEWKMGGEFDISGMRIIGNNIPNSPSNPYFNKPAFGFGLHITNLKKIVINNIVVQNVYGQGIQVDASSPKTKLADRADEVLITNNKILNCWGFHPVADDYGDGIYLSYVKHATINNNVIDNDLKVTKQYGRAGIVLEYDAQDCTIENNTIYGYDRGIHIENDLGGHQVINNKLLGSDLGILVYGMEKGQVNPIKIAGNTIEYSKADLANGGHKFRSVRAGIVFQGVSSLYKGSVITDNKITMPNKSFKALNIDSKFNLKVESNNIQEK